MDQLLANKNDVSPDSEAKIRAEKHRPRWYESVWLMIAVGLIIRLLVMRFAYLNLLDPARDHYLAGWEGDHFSLRQGI